MIKRLNFLLFLSLFVNSFSIAQEIGSTNPDYKISKPFRVFDFDDNFYVSKNEEIVVVKFIRNNCMIQRFNTSSPELIKENKYSGFFPNGFQLEAFKNIEDKYYLFYSLVNKDKRCDEIYAQEIDFEKAEFVNQPKLALSANGKVYKTKQSEYLHQNRITENIRFEFIQTGNKSNLLIKYLSEVDDKNLLGIELFDKTLTKIYTKSLPIDKYDKKNTIISSQIDKNGNLFFISKKTPEEKDLLPKFFLNIIAVNKNEIIQRKINTNKYINDIWVRDTNEEILCCGFISDFDTSRSGKLFGRTPLNDANGLIYLKVNADGVFLENREFEFPDNISNLSKNKENKKYIENLYLHDFDILENGDRIIVGEQFVNDIERGFNGVEQVHRYRDLVICKLNKNGQVDFMKRLPKLQVSQNEMQPFSFKTFYTDSFIYLPFIDALKNLSPENAKIIPSGGDLILSRISLINGDISRKFILNIGHKGEDLNKFSINRFYKSNLNSFCFDAYKKNKEDVLISIDLN